MLRITKTLPIKEDKIPAEIKKAYKEKSSIHFFYDDSDENADSFSISIDFDEHCEEGFASTYLSFPRGGVFRKDRTKADVLSIINTLF